MDEPHELDTEEIDLLRKGSDGLAACSIEDGNEEALNLDVPNEEQDDDNGEYEDEDDPFDRIHELNITPEFNYVNNLCI
ncbi:unnamed protein product [Cuscuta campestris]|uniref:Uncharacterized protein n=1 Tax=Cuscuta campestris TaxID=132261 RepID=A0A484N673_9ASTE|nr:unnamed protein product [Cuscuta campestris]